MGDELRDGDDVSLAWALLFGLTSSEPGAGKELGDAVGGPVGGDLVDDVDEVDVGVDAGKLAVEQDGEHVRVALASVEAADEQRVLPESQMIGRAWRVNRCGSADPLGFHEQPVFW
jgi:hypothetical protein